MRIVNTKELDRISMKQGISLSSKAKARLVFLVEQQVIKTLELSKKEQFFLDKKFIQVPSIENMFYKASLLFSVKQIMTMSQSAPKK